MKFENDLGAAYANNEGMDKVIEDSEGLDTEEEEKVENDENEKSGYDDLKEAYAKDREAEVDENTDNNTDDIEDVSEEVEANTEDVVEKIEMDNNKQVAEAGESLTKKLSFEEVGKQKWESMSSKITNFVKQLLEKGKKAIYTATGVAFESPEMAKEAYESAKISFDKAVDSANEKAQEVKIKSIEKAKEAKVNFLEKITGVRDKYTDKAVELKSKGVEWGINKAVQVERTINQTHESISSFIQEMELRTTQANVEKYRQRVSKEEAKLAKLMTKIGEKGTETNRDIKSMKRAFDNVSELSI